MLNLFLGAVAGFAGGYVIKGQTSKQESVASNGAKYSALYNDAQSEISKLKSDLRNRDSEIEDLNQRIKSLTKKIRDFEDKTDDHKDDIDDMRRTIESLRRQNDELNEKMADYKSLYTAAQQEIERLKG